MRQPLAPPENRETVMSAAEEMGQDIPRAAQRVTEGIRKGASENESAGKGCKRQRTSGIFTTNAVPNLLHNSCH
jgi:hypothetical protein